MWLLGVACVSAHCNEWNVSKRLRAESVKCTKCMKWNTKKENDGVHSSTYARTHTQRRRTIHFHLTLYKMHKITFFICRCLCVCVCALVQFWLLAFETKRLNCLQHAIILMSDCHCIRNYNDSSMKMIFSDRTQPTDNVAALSFLHWKKLRKFQSLNFLCNFVVY